MSADGVLIIENPKVQERRNGVMRLSPRLLKESLHMPEGSEIYGVEWSFRDDYIFVYVTHPSLPDAHEGTPVMPVHLFVEEYCKAGKNERGDRVVEKAYESKWVL